MIVASMDDFAIVLSDVDPCTPKLPLQLIVSHSVILLLSLTKQK